MRKKSRDEIIKSVVASVLALPIIAVCCLLLYWQVRPTVAFIVTGEASHLKDALLAYVASVLFFLGAGLVCLFWFTRRGIGRSR